MIAGLTQLIYPYLYDQLLALNFWMLLVLSARNVLYLCCWSGRSGACAAAALRRRPELVDESNWMPRVWPFVPERGTHSERTRS